MKIIGYCFLISFLWGCCIERRNETGYTIDIQSIPQCSFDELVDEITCFPLRKSESAFFDCWELISYKGYFYLYSLSDFIVQIYDKNGWLVKRIDNRGRGRIETPTDILINEKREELWICDSRNKLNKYTLQGDFKESLQRPISCVKMIQVGKDNILVYKSLFEKSSGFLFHLYTDEWEGVDSFIKKGNMTRVPASYSPSLFANDMRNGNKYAFICQKQMIYKYENKGLIPFIYLDFHGDFLTEEKYPQQGFSDEEMGEIISQGKYIYSVHNFQAVDDKLLFRAKGKESMFYLIDCGKLKGVKFCSLFDGYNPNLTNPVAGSDKEYLYVVQKKEDLVKYYKDKESCYETIKSLICSDEELDGVVIRIKLK